MIARLRWHRFLLIAAMVLPLSLPFSAAAQQHFNGERALEITRQFVAVGPRWVGSPGHAKAEAFLRNEFKHDALEEDAFTANTPIGPVPMRNFIVRFPGKKDGVIVLTTHYETNYPLRNTGFVGANDGGSTTGLLIEIANEIRGRVQEGYGVYLKPLELLSELQIVEAEMRAAIAALTGITWPKRSDYERARNAALERRRIAP